MLKAVFKKTGQTENFAAWLKKFKEIDNSILIEVDKENKRFLARSFTSDHGLIRRSEITFEDAGFELNKIDDTNMSSSIIKTGIFMILDKFISIINTFSSTDYEMVIEFDFNEETSVYQAVGIGFKSKTLSMHIDCGNLSEFVEIKEDEFQKLYVAEDPVIGTISEDVVKNLLGIANMLSIDNKNDSIKFYTKKTKYGIKMYAKDSKSNSYDYLLGNVEGKQEEVDLVVYVSKFIMSTKYSSGEMKLYISSKSADRLLIENENEKSKVIIAVVI